MASEYGFIYVLGNDSMPGVYKIGFTLNHPKARMEQLSSATACPTPFDMLACFGVENPRDVERMLHSMLATHRINSSREFFKCKAQDIIDAISEYEDGYDDLSNMRRLNNQSYIEDEDAWHAGQQWKVSYFLVQEADPIEWPDDIPFPKSGGLN